MYLVVETKRDLRRQEAATRQIVPALAQSGSGAFEKEGISWLNPHHQQFTSSPV